MSKRSIQIQETLYCDIDVSAKSLTVAIGRLDSQLGKPICFGFACHQLPHRDVFDEEQVQVARKEDVLNSLSQIAGKYRTRVGESLVTVEKHNTLLAGRHTITRSLESLQHRLEDALLNWSGSRFTSFPTCNRNRLRVC
jgi:hypothetical protein